jgi:hypothetical protein
LRRNGLVSMNTPARGLGKRSLASPNFRAEVPQWGRASSCINRRHGKCLRGTAPSCSSRMT